jgi:hypothetical protein
MGGIAPGTGISELLLVSLVRQQKGRLSSVMGMAYLIKSIHSNSYRVPPDRLRYPLIYCTVYTIFVIYLDC